ITHGPNRPLTHPNQCCDAARQSGLSPQPRNQRIGEFTHRGQTGIQALLSHLGQTLIPIIYRSDFAVAQFSHSGHSL
ncbi:MAG: hypothetical protein ABJO67_15445, partial [Pseudoruegeria sp.]